MSLTRPGEGNGSVPAGFRLRALFNMAHGSTEICHYCSHVNIGVGQGIGIAQLSGLIAEATGFGGNIEFDESKPDGAPWKLPDVSRAASMGWSGANGAFSTIAQNDVSGRVSITVDCWHVPAYFAELSGTLVQREHSRSYGRPRVFVRRFRRAFRSGFK